MNNEIVYNSPSVFTITKLRSKNAEDESIELARKVGALLRERNIMTSEWDLPDQNFLIIQYMEWAKRFPVRKSPEHWIDFGSGMAGVHPITNLPFLMNLSGAIICRLCIGKLNIEDILIKLGEQWPFVQEDLLIKDLLSFLFLLEELDLLEFKE